MKLRKNDIVGQYIVDVYSEVCVVEEYEITYASTYFKLNNNITFSLPIDSKTIFEDANIPDKASKIEDETFKEIYSCKILSLLRPTEDREFDLFNTAYLFLENGIWLTSYSDAPFGVDDCVGLYIDNEKPEDYLQLKCYWS